MFCFLGSPATAAEPGVSSAYCRKTQARANADAALLLTPKLLAQGLRYPATGVDPTAVFGVGTQFRAGLSFSPTDFIKGLKLSSVADADCERQETNSRIEEFLEEAADGFRRRALRAQVDFLVKNQNRWKSVLKTENELFQRRAVTLLELSELKARVFELEKILIQTRGLHQQLGSRDLSNLPRTIQQARAQYVNHTSRFEKAASGVRAMDAWQFRVLGGVAISERPADWFALAEVTVSLGVVNQLIGERRYLAARADEAANGRHEAGDRLRVLQTQLIERRAQATAELRILDDQIAGMEATRTSLETVSAHGADHAVGVLQLEEISKGAQRAYLRGLIESLSELLSSDTITG